MKKTILFVFVILFASAAAFSQSQQTLPWFGTHYQPGNMSYSLEAGADFGADLSLAAIPSAEIIITKFRPFNLFSIDLGLAVRGLAALTFGTTGTTTTVGGGPLLMFHGGLRGMSGSFGTVLDQVDFYTGFGLGYLLSLGAASGGSLAWANASGLNFFLSDSLALRFGTSYFSPFSGGVGSFSTNVGVTLKLGPAEELGDGIAFSMPDPDAVSGEANYFTFSSLYALALFSGGYLPSDESFEVGDGVVIAQEFTDDDGDVQQITLFRALLHRGDEQDWWRYEFSLDDEEFAFEAAIDEAQEIVLLRYEDQVTGEVSSYEPANSQQFAAYRGDYAPWSEERIAALVTGQERVTVPAGTFGTDRLESEDEDGSFTWWISDEVPGRMIRFEGRTDDSGTVSGELVEIVRGFVSPWGRAW